MKHEEMLLQRGIVTYLRSILPEREWRLFSVPNGGRRDPREMANMKTCGLLPGVPDLVLVGTCGRCFFIEVKTESGRLTEAQQDFREWMILAGVPHVVARSLDDVRAALAHWNIATREAA